jgi:hydroxymethylglutaryl-CoA reductase
MKKTINGFSKLTKDEKIDWLTGAYFGGSAEAATTLKTFWQSDIDLQRIIDGFSENTLSNFVIPYGVAPNFIINGKPYCVPMTIEESSVVAAASSAAKFWSERGGFHAEVVNVKKVGQLHFLWSGERHLLRGEKFLQKLNATLRAETAPLTANMQKRGGGILAIEIVDFTDTEKNYYQIRATFQTCDSMGANFINSVLEQFGETLEWFLAEETGIEPQIVMAILSNYTPECLVRAWVECPTATFGTHAGLSPEALAEKFRLAVRIAQIDPYRATTHNKGIFNGIDAVILATANDFRAIEACGHTYAARDGQYRSLSDCTTEGGIFRFQLELPLAVGTVGGLTSLHPLAKISLAMLGNPSAQELMQVVAAVGLAQNFAAVRSLVTSGIQQGHMKMHLTNILNHLQASPTQAEAARQHFMDKVVSFTNVRQFLDEYK